MERNGCFISSVVSEGFLLLVLVAISLLFLKIRAIFFKKQLDKENSSPVITGGNLCDSGPERSGFLRHNLTSSK